MPLFSSASSHYLNWIKTYLSSVESLKEIFWIQRIKYLNIFNWWNGKMLILARLQWATHSSRSVSEHLTSWDTLPSMRKSKLGFSLVLVVGSDVLCQTGVIPVSISCFSCHIVVKKVAGWVPRMQTNRLRSRPAPRKWTPVGNVQFAMILLMQNFSHKDDTNLCWLKWISDHADCFIVRTSKAVKATEL